MRQNGLRAEEAEAARMHPALDRRRCKMAATRIKDVGALVHALRRLLLIFHTSENKHVGLDEHALFKLYINN